MSIQDIQADERYLNLLAEAYPNISAVTTQIINLESVMSLPKGTEHFLSDLHGADKAFAHVLKNASGVIRTKVNDLFPYLTTEDKDALCAMIYYPKERLAFLHEQGVEMEPLYRDLLLEVVDVARAVTIKYSQVRVRSLLPKDFAYTIEELLQESNAEFNRRDYYNTIINTIIRTGRAEDFLVAISYLIHSLVIDTLHIVGDIFDRGPGAYKIMEVLCNYHSFDIQWGNHDIEWMGAAAGNLALIASVLRVSIRYANVETLEEDYSINLLPLADFAIHTYGDDPCSVFQTKDFEANPRMKRSARLMTLMHKAMSIIQFKLEGQIIQRHPEYQMEDRLLLDKINLQDGTINIEGKTYPLLDTHFPTIDPNAPYALSQEEQQLMNQLLHSFRRSKALQKHLRCLYDHGSLYLVRNNCLLYHAAIPLTESGEFKSVTLNGRIYKGKDLMSAIDHEIRQAYYAPAGTEERERALDYMWYLWCGQDSPLYNKDKMTTFERYFIEDKDLQKENKGAYYVLANTEETCQKILQEFGLDPSCSRIINGHIPVHTMKGESPIRANGLRLVIDGGFSKPYQTQTGLAGYTLIYNSYGMQLIEHKQFLTKDEAVRSGTEEQSEKNLVNHDTNRMFIRDTDQGKELTEQVRNLENLLMAYQHGLIKERYCEKG